MIYLRGKPIRYRVPKQAINDGICYITEDRKLNGFFETMRIDDNIYVEQARDQGGLELPAVARRRAASWRITGSSG